MAAKKALTVNQMAIRILERDDNDRKQTVIRDIINMYMDECRKALINGERIQLSGIGTIIPEVKVNDGEYHIPELYCRPPGFTVLHSFIHLAGALQYKIRVGI